MALLEPELIFHEMGGVCDSRRCGDEPCDPQLLDGFDILWTEFYTLRNSVKSLFSYAMQFAVDTVVLEKSSSYRYLQLFDSQDLFAQHNSICNLIVLRDYNNNKFIVYSTI